MLTRESNVVGEDSPEVTSSSNTEVCAAPVTLQALPNVDKLHLSFEGSTRGALFSG